MSFTLKAQGHSSADSSDSDSNSEEIGISMTPQDLDTLSQCYGIHLREAGWDSRDEERTAFRFNLGPCSDDSVLISRNDQECDRIANDLRFLMQENCTEATYSHWLYSLMPPSLNKKNLVLNINELMSNTSKFNPPKPSGDNCVELSTWDFRADWLFFYTKEALSGTIFKVWARRYGTLAGRRATIALNVELKCEKGAEKLARAQALAAAALTFKQRLEIRRAAGRADYKDLKHYFCIFRSSHFELYRMIASSDGVLNAWRLKIPSFDLSTSDGIRVFIDVWNSLMAELLGPSLESLVKDLRKIGSLDQAARRGRRRVTRSSGWADPHEGLV